MSIKYSASSAQVTNVQIVDSDNLVIPNGDFVIATMIHTDGAFGPSQQHLINAGITFGAGHFALILEPGGQINAQTDVNQSGVNSIHQTALELNKAYLVGMQRTGTTVKSFFCPVLQTAPADGSAVSFSTKSRSLNVALNSSGNPNGNVTIGQRLGNSSNRADHSMSRAFACVGTLTSLDLAKLAYGMEITDIGKIPLWYIRGNDGADTDDRSPNKSATLRSTGADPLPAGTAFNFGYVSVNRAPTVTAPSIDGDPEVGKSISAISGTVDGFPFPEISWQWLNNGADISGATSQSYVPTADDESDKLRVRQSVHSTQGDAFAVSAEKTVAASPTAVYITPPESEMVLQQSAGVAQVPFSGTFSGAEQPAKIELRLFDPDGTTVRRTWTDVSATIVAGGTWSARPSIPFALKKYRAQVRTLRANGTVLAESVVHANRFGVGLVVVLAGSSSAQTWGRASTGAVATDSVSQIRHPNAWSTATTLGTKMADYIAPRIGMAVGVISGGVSGSSIGGGDGWAATNGGKWGGIREVVVACGGRVGLLMATVGSNDAAAAAVLSVNSHVALIESVVSIARGLNTVESNPTMPVIWSGMNRRWSKSNTKTVAEFDASVNHLREAEKVIGKLPNVYLWQSTHYPLSGDGTHLADAGFDQQTADMAWFAVEMFGGRYPHGPQINKLSWSGDTVFIDVAHGNGTDLTPSLGGTAITVTDDSATPPTRVSTQRVSATRYSAKYDRVLINPQVKHLSGGDFEYTAPILDNGTVPMPMSVETLMATTEATAEPVTPTVTSVTVSPSTATGSTTFSAVVAGTNSPSQGVTWTASAGSISSSGVFTAPARTSSVQTITITARSTFDTTKTGTATVTLAATATPTVTSVVISPGTATGSATFSAVVNGTNSPSQSVTWTASAGSISSSGVFTAPAANSSAQSITITARSVLDTSKAGTASVTIAAVTVPPEATNPPTFTRSQSRTINITEVPGVFDQDGRFWNLAIPKKPTGSIDPNATIDITFNWTALLADIQDSISEVQFDIIGLTNKGAFRDGAFATIFVGSAVSTPSSPPSITCRITTASIPPRVEDRTVFLTVEQH